MKRIQSALALLLMLLGVGLMAYTPAFYDAFSSEALSFAGAGLMWALLGFTNLLLVERRQLWTRVVGVLANAASLVFAVTLLWTLSEFHTYLRVALVAGLLYCSLASLRQMQGQKE